MSDDYTNQEPVQPHTYTEIDDVGFVCNDCGAWGMTPEEVAHYPTCKPGESARWQKYYEEAADDDGQGTTELNEIEQGRWDDDPSPYDGTYSEE